MSAVVRVAVAEIRTAVYRAYVVEGASSGEAEVAGATCAVAEVQIGGGLRLAVDGLGHIPHERIGGRVEEGSPARLIDPADRAAVLQLRMALDWLGDTGRAIVLPGIAFADALVAGLPDGVAAIGPERGVAAADGGYLLFDGAGGLTVSAADGVLLIRASPTDVREYLGSAALAHRWRQACAEGIEVDAAAWHALDEVAVRYLVPDA